MGSPLGSRGARPSRGSRKRQTLSLHPALLARARRRRRRRLGLGRLREEDRERDGLARGGGDRRAAAQHLARDDEHAVGELLGDRVADAALVVEARVRAREHLPELGEQEVPAAVRVAAERAAADRDGERALVANRSILR